MTMMANLNSKLGLFRLGTRWLSSTGSGPGKRVAAVWGNGDYGRLGLGSLDSQWSPTPLLCSAFQDQSLEAVACGGAHTLFLTQAGRVFATGLNDFGQLGASTDVPYATEPVEVSGINKPVVQISAGYYHSCAVTVLLAEDGELYMWGKNSYGQLGLGKRGAKTVPAPAKVECLAGITIRMVALGSEHSVAVTDGGESLSWGGGSGRLGHGPESGILGIFKSTGSKKLLLDCCIQHALTGSLKGKNGTAPSMISRLPCSEEVSCGGYHTCVITSGGELYSWGSNENGCLGIGTTDVLHLPERVQGPFLKSAVIKVSCGWKHTAAISEGNIFTWGWGGSHGTFSEEGHSSGGQLGQGTDVDYIKPMRVKFGENLKALQISCGFNHTGAILEYT
ncbi:ultraviolet-B receptor UVR8 isoform X4 [Rosa chinensis]|uniref:ultraviolet-B receptor UVR8 isoform X4 n=1 Tax=Rosa chinensis TaxID=74649 RepID=UPI001AD930DC|nr:ultraviolet-B receptor UVR8 isoform X4 [Rosa chinensis]